ncbi:MAG TPA: hypothetical protein VEX39_06185 [Thermoleophilaceae bacterium]|nr:hypothetical protein [Thermoleophilaceae bacterium]
MRTGALGIAAALVLAGAADAHAGRSWDPPRVAKAVDGSPMRGTVRAAYTGRGELVAAWTLPQMKVSVRPPRSRVFGQPVLLDEGIASKPRLVTNQRGDALLTWISNYWGTRVVSRAPGGAWESQPVFGSSGTPVAAALGPRGEAAVAFRAPYESVELAYRPPGGQFGDPVALGARQDGRQPESDPDVAVMRDGTAVVVWQDRDASGRFVVRGAQRTPAGTMTPVQTLSRPGTWGQTPSVTADAAGNAIVAWVEGDGEWGSGSVMTSKVLARCCFGPPHRSAATGYREGLNAQALEPGVALISFFGLDRELAERGTSPHGPTVLGVYAANAATTPPQRLHVGIASTEYRVAANARGDAAMALDRSGALKVSRRAPGSPFARRIGVSCDTNRFLVSHDAAMSPGGDLSVFARDTRSGDTLLFEDRPAAQDSDCDPEPAGPRRRAGRLALQARMPRGGKLVRGRWLVLRASCGMACHLRATGLLKIEGRRRRVPLSTGTGKRVKAGTATVRVGLTRARARVVRRALRGGRGVRARIRLRASGGKAGRTLTFRVRLRR